MNSRTALDESKSELCEVARNAIHDLVYIIDASGRIVDANERFYSEAGRLPSCGGTLDGLLAEDERAIARRVWQSVIETRRPERSIRRLRSAAGTVRVLDTLETAAIAGDKVIGVVGVARDVSEESALDDRIWETQENMEAALEYAVRASLGLIKGYVFSLQRMDRLPLEQRDRYGKVIIEEIETLSRNIENLLIHRGHFDEAAERELCDVAEIAKEVEALVKAEAERREINIELSVSRQEVMLYSQREAVHRILLNLVDHCMLRVTHKGRIQLKITDSGEYIDITLCDTGPALHESKIGGLFSETVPTGVDSDGGAVGSKIDLFVARILCESLGGGLIARATPDGHMEFAVMLPRHSVMSEDSGMAMPQHQ